MSAPIPHRPGALAALKARGLFQQCTDEAALADALDRGPLTFYVGVDPTARSLHIGHMVPIYALAHLASYGHQPIVLVGTGTARIGDPTGRSEARTMMTAERIDANADAVSRQLERFLLDRGVQFIAARNWEWLGDLGYIAFLRDIGVHFSVNRMLTFETYKARMETGLSFVEFNYQLLQSYDFLELSRRHDCRLQIGGDDQWGNIVAGADLIRLVRGNTVPAFGLTFPLITRADGKKMGKSERGAVYLDPDLYRPYDFYQYLRNVADPDVARCLRLFTFLPIEAIDRLTAGTGAELNAAKERLAYEVTLLVHGQSEAQAARTAARALFGDGGDIASMPGAELSAAQLGAGIAAVDLFVRAGLAASKGEARRLIQQGGARINDQKVATVDEAITAARLTDSATPGTRQLVLRAGKKRFFRFSVPSDE